jgi:hypothetical protein
MRCVACLLACLLACFLRAQTRQRGEEQFAPSVISVSTKHKLVYLCCTQSVTPSSSSFSLLENNTFLLFLLGSRRIPYKCPASWYWSQYLRLQRLNILFADYTYKAFKPTFFDPPYPLTGTSRYGLSRTTSGPTEIQVQGFISNRHSHHYRFRNQGSRRYIPMESA